MSAEATFKDMISSKEWSRFWARANELGWKKDEVHAHFGLETMKDFAGTLDDALAMLEAPAPEPEPEPADDFPPEDPTYYPEPPHIENTVAPLRTWTEAPASVTIAAYCPSGFDILLTIRDDDAPGLMTRMGNAVAWLSKNGYRPKYGNGNGGTNRRKPQSAAPQAQATNGDAPVCNLHNKPMKRSQHFAGWFCPTKLADGSYCKEQVQDD